MRPAGEQNSVATTDNEEWFRRKKHQKQNPAVRGACLILFLCLFEAVSARRKTLPPD